MTVWTKGRVAHVSRALARHRRAARGVAWLVFACAAVFVGTAVAAAPSAPSLCDGPFAPGHVLPPGGRRSLQPDDATPQSIAMRFDDSLAPLTQPLGLDITYDKGDDLKGAGVQAWVVEGQLTTTDGHEIPAHFGPLFNQRITGPAHADVCMQLDPRAVKDLRSGEYHGQIRVSVDDGQPFSFPLAVSFRASRWRAAAFAGLGVVLGLIVKICSELAVRHRSNRIPARLALREYIRDWSFPVVLILGAISGWLGYVQIYDVNPTWGASGSDELRLFGTCFAFQLGSVGGLDLARRLTGDVAAAPDQPTMAAA